jgi:hypothetical protein
MPLRDHFHPPVSNKRHWSAILGGWPMEIVRTLFDRLPWNFYAAPQIELGRSLESEIGFIEDVTDAGETATLTALQKPATYVADFSQADEYEVRIHDDTYDRTLVAAIEIVSPSNKDRPDTRNQFVSKVRALLSEGVCVSIVDIVTSRQANLYSELLTALGHSDSAVERSSSLYAVTLRRRIRHTNESILEAWHYPLAIGDPLPTIPLWLSGKLVIELPLESGYAEVCRLLRL